MPDHLDIPKIDTQIAIITGDPDRIKMIADLFSRSEPLPSKRGYVFYRAWIDQIEVLIASTNIGAPSTAIVVEELIELGITVIIRLGTCGAIQPFIAPGHLTIPNGCVRDEGTSQQYIDLAFPAIPDTVVLCEMQHQAARAHYPYHVGITHCKDAYYMERPDKQLDVENTRHRWALWRAAKVLVTEMETAVLFTLGALRGIRTGAILINVGRTTPEMEKSLAVAVEIIKRTIEKLVKDKLVPPAKPVAPPELSFLDKRSYQSS